MFVFFPSHARAHGCAPALAPYSIEMQIGACWTGRVLSIQNIDLRLFDEIFHKRAKLSAHMAKTTKELPRSALWKISRALLG